MESDGLLERFREELAGRIGEDDLAVVSGVARRMQQRLLNTAIRQLKEHGQPPEPGNEGWPTFLSTVSRTSST